MERMALNTAEVAQMLGFSDPECVQKLAKAKRLRGVKVGGEWRFHPEAVRRFLLDEPEGHQPDPEPDEPPASRRRGSRQPDWLKGVAKTYRK